jgi:ProP effector
LHAQQLRDNHGLNLFPNPMTSTPPDASIPTSEPSPSTDSPAKAVGQKSIQSVLEKLFELYPHLFGAEFLPLKLGIFQELLAAHPEVFERASLKAALGTHTRSTRYLQCVAAGKKRHDLQGNAVEDVAPEHVYLSMLELFRRRAARAREDLRPKFRAQLIQAFEASGLSRQDYQARVQNSDEAATALLVEALDEHDERQARQDALLKTFEASGKSVDEFADMYGLDKRDVIRALERKAKLEGQTAAG